MATSSQSDFLRALYQSWSDRMAANPGLTIGEWMLGCTAIVNDHGGGAQVLGQVPGELAVTC